MFRLLILCSLIFTLWGCSNSKSKFVYDDLSVDTGEGVETSSKPVQAKKTLADYSKPTTFDEYRQWRKANDTSGQTYAEYKEWAAAYKQWTKDQARAAPQ
jgi:hypothetical protein